MLDVPSLRRVKDDGRNTGRAFVGWQTIAAPAFEQRSHGGIGAAGRDTYRPGMRSAGQERPERHDPRHPAALGHIEERLRVGAPSLVGLRPAKQEEAVSASLLMPREELAAWPLDLAFAIGPQTHLGSFLSQHKVHLGVYDRQSRDADVTDEETPG